MMDHELRIRRLEAESEDPETALILLDVVLGYGSHPDPAAELVPAIKTARSKAKKAGRYLEVVTVISGTDADPQDMKSQEEQFLKAGTHVFHSNDAAVRYAGRLVRALEGIKDQDNNGSFTPVDLESLTGEFSAINVGLESFTESLLAQNVGAVQVDWKPAAGGDADLMALLEKMKG